MPRLGFTGSFFAVWVGWIGPFCYLESAATPPDAREILKQGTIEAGVGGGFWHAFHVPGETHPVDRHAWFIMPRIGMVMTDEVQAGFFSGNLELLLEPFYAYFTEPFSADAAGGAVVMKYNLLSFGRWMPFWDAGVGMLWTDLAPRIPEDSSQFNFYLETGPGVHYFITTRTAVTLAVRYNHISNAGIGDRNLGLDGVLGYVGLSWFLPK